MTRIYALGKSILFTLIILLFFSVNFGSCGYKFGLSSNLSQYRTIDIPYIEGDDKGILTAGVVKEIVSRSSIRYTRGASDLVLRIKLEDPYGESIGFNYAKSLDGKQEKQLTASEKRLSQKAIVELIEVKTGKVILGPKTVQANIEYDQSSSYVSRGPLNASQGQLQQPIASDEFASEKIFDILAYKIANAILH